MATMVIRPSRAGDLDSIFRLAESAGTGMTNLPPDRATLAARIAASVNSVTAEVSEPGTETYLFVLEDTASGEIVGTSGIYARIGFGKLFYSYKILTLTQTSSELGITVTSRLLQLVNDFTGLTEIGMLYLSPDYRRDGNGRLLGIARYLFMAEFPDRFVDEVMAEIRGWFDDDDRSPFWDALGSHFFGMAYPKADFLSAVGNNQFIADLMPKHPIYIDLLGAEAQSVIGKPHRDTRPALELLKQEGFRYHDYVDIFDGGPTLQARCQDIRGIRESRRAEIGAVARDRDVADRGDFIPRFAANCRIADFRVCRALVRAIDDDHVEIPAATAEALQIGKGDPVRFVNMFWDAQND